MLRVAPLLLAALVALLAASPAAAQTRTDPPRMTEIVVTLEAPPLATRVSAGRDLYTTAARRTTIATDRLLRWIPRAAIV